MGLRRETACIELCDESCAKGALRLGLTNLIGTILWGEIHAQYTDPAKPVPATKYIIRGQARSYYDFESKDKNKCRIHIGGYIPSGFKYITRPSGDNKFFHRIFLLNPEVQGVISNKERFQRANYANSGLIPAAGVEMEFPKEYEERNYTEGTALVLKQNIQELKSAYIKNLSEINIDKLNPKKIFDSFPLKGFTKLVAEKNKMQEKDNYHIVIEGSVNLEKNKSYIARVTVPIGTSFEIWYYECEVDKNSEAGPRVIVKKALARKPEIKNTYREHFLNPKPSFVKPSVSLVHRRQLTPENIEYFKKERVKKIKADADIYLGIHLQPITSLAVELRNRSTDLVGKILLLQH